MDKGNIFKWYKCPELVCNTQHDVQNVRNGEHDLIQGDRLHKMTMKHMWNQLLMMYATLH